MAFLTRPLSPVGFGAFKIGRNVGAKYERTYELPDVAAADALLNGLLDAGLSYIDTAPAYGMSEERIGEAVAHRRGEFSLSTKVGEFFSDGASRYDFSAEAVRASVKTSLRRLRTNVLDLVFIHAPREDVQVLKTTEVVTTLMQLREKGVIRGIGLSGHTMAGFRATLPWADAIMVTYNPDDPSLASVIAEAAARNILVIAKKGLGAGRLSPAKALPWILRNPAVTSVVIGSLSLEHMRDNLRIAQEARPPRP